jgi:hypothetical protein
MGGRREFSVEDREADEEPQRGKRGRRGKGK